MMALFVIAKNDNDAELYHIAMINLVKLRFLKIGLLLVSDYLSNNNNPILYSDMCANFIFLN
jgi:hypothetical protein